MNTHIDNSPEQDFLTMVKAARESAEILAEQNSVLLVSHIDADGISAAGIASTVLDRLGVDYEVLFLRSMDKKAAEDIRDKKMFTWLCDLGSSSMSLLFGIRGIITDHHIPDTENSSVCNHIPNNMRGNILAYTETASLASVPESQLIQVNPHLCGFDGTSHLSGAGSTFALAMAASQNNIDLAPLAIVGAVGDMQDREGMGLIGPNRGIAVMAEENGFLRIEKDLKYYGRETRGLPKFLLFGQEKPVPGLDVEEGVVELLRRTGIRLEDHRGWWRVWVDLSWDEKEAVMSALIEHMGRVGMGEEIENLLGEVYSLTREKPGSGFYDAKEFSTMLNSCGRYDRADLGLKLAKGDRHTALKEAREMRRGHRKNIVSSLAVVKDIGIKETEHLFWFNSENRIRDTVVGTVAGMYLKNIGGKKPILAFAYVDESNTKASIRCSQELVDMGLDMSAIVSTACAVVGGEGGGHKIAAGATIPRGTERTFVDTAEKALAECWPHS